MRFIRFEAGGIPRLGAEAGNLAVDLLAAARGRIGGDSGQDPALEAMFDPDLNGLVRSGPVGLHNARRIVAAARAGDPGVHPISAVRILAPVVAPSKILCVGQNYLDHIREQKAEVPRVPILFSKAPTAIIGPGEAIRWAPGLTAQADLEVELGVIIGTRMSGVPAARALDHVFGYTIINDVSARDLQFGDKQWVRGKSLDTFCPLGPAVVTRDEIPDPQALRLTSACSGRTWQESSTREMIFPVATLLSFISEGITLLPGDLVATGTPHGVGMFQNPQVFLQAGDHLRLEVERIGVLENPVEGAGGR